MKKFFTLLLLAIFLFSPIAYARNHATKNPHRFRAVWIAHAPHNATPTKKKAGTTTHHGNWTSSVKALKEALAEGSYDFVTAAGVEQAHKKFLFFRQHAHRIWIVKVRKIPYQWHQ